MRRFMLVMVVCVAAACGDTASMDDAPVAGTGGTAAATGGQSGSLGGSGGAGGSGMQPATGGNSGAGTGGSPAAGSGGTGSGGAMAMIDAGHAGETKDSGMPDGSLANDAGGALAIAKGLDALFVHDACTGEYAPQQDTCLHEQTVEQKVTLGGTAGTVYDVTLRVRGLFEPTTVSGGQVPMTANPYFKVGGSVAAADYSHWHIIVSNPAQTYTLNHYPSTSHTIYQEDFEATIQVAGGAQLTIGAHDGNDREIDNAEEGIADRRQLIDGVTDQVLDGQMLRLDVVDVAPR